MVGWCCTYSLWVVLCCGCVIWDCVSYCCRIAFALGCVNSVVVGVLCIVVIYYGYCVCWLFVVVCGYCLQLVFFGTVSLHVGLNVYAVALACCCLCLLILLGCCGL